MNDSQERIDEIIRQIDSLYADGVDTLLSTKIFLDKIRCIATGQEIPAMSRPKQLDHIVISCDASIKNNPGGPASIGVVIQVPGQPDLEIAQVTRDTTNNQAEYNAIYTGLVSLVNLRNQPGMEIEVHSDSQLAIKQIRGDMVCKDAKLLNKCEAIRELVMQIPAPVKFIWRPRCSTPQLTKANYLCQDLLEVPRH